MQLIFVPADRIPWEAMGDAMEPVLQKNGKPFSELRAEIETGRSAAFLVPGGWVICFTAYPKDREDLTLWVWMAAGAVPGGPKARLASMRASLSAIETMGAENGCKAVRIEGRKAWRRIAPEYQEIGRDGMNIIFEKELSHG